MICVVSFVFLAVNQVSCLALRNSGPAGEIVKEIIDIDGSGPLEPFPVTCHFRGNNQYLR